MLDGVNTVKRVDEVFILNIVVDGVYGKITPCRGFGLGEIRNGGDHKAAVSGTGFIFPAEDITEELNTRALR